MDSAGSDDASDCINCALGKYVDVMGSDAESDCIRCRAGRWVGVMCI